MAFESLPAGESSDAIDEPRCGAVISEDKPTTGNGSKRAPHSTEPEHFDARSRIVRNIGIVLRVMRETPLEC
jgi:hypothetical protein